MDKHDRERSLGRAVGLIHRRAMTYMDHELAHLGLGRGTFEMLVTLYFDDGMRQEELTRELAINKGTTTRTVDKLAGLGYVRREADPTDGRACRVVLTDKAMAIKGDFLDVLDTGTKVLARGFTQAERHRALDLLKRMHANLEQYIGESRGEDTRV